jgi:hypothetical protein
MEKLSNYNKRDLLHEMAFVLIDKGGTLQPEGVVMYDDSSHVTLWVGDTFITIHALVKGFFIIVDGETESGVSHLHFRPKTPEELRIIINSIEEIYITDFESERC